MPGLSRAGQAEGGPAARRARGRSWPAASTGPAVVPGNPKESLLVDAINYGETYQMPPKSKLPAAEIATLTEWVQRGAPWGVETPAATSNPAAAKEPGKSGSALEGRIPGAGSILVLPAARRVTPPAVKTGPPAGRATRSIASSWPRSSEHGLTPAPEADSGRLIRRLSFDLTGLPPTPEEVAAFLADPAPDAYERLVDRLLASPHYGERWARHWLDLVRYAETAGHEFDYDIPNAFRYRDYVIRAFNADLPYDQFVIEQIAGDLLETPAPAPGRGLQRVDPRDGILFPRRGDAFAGRRPRRADAADRQPDRRALQDVPGPHGRLCPLPRPQVRPDHQPGLLRPGRVPPQLAASAGVHRSSRADRPPASSGCASSRRRSLRPAARGRARVCRSRSAARSPTC